MPPCWWLSRSVDELAREFDNLRGRILGLIESWGLPEVQERGCKSTFKVLSYDAQAKIAALLEPAE